MDDAERVRRRSRALAEMYLQPLFPPVPFTPAEDGPVCGKVAPWGAACPSAAGHHEAHDWYRNPLTSSSRKGTIEP